MIRVPMPMPFPEVIRTYLGHRFQVRSTLRTTEEFLREMETGTALRLAEHRESLRSFLQACDLLKFRAIPSRPAGTGAGAGDGR